MFVYTFMNLIVPHRFTLALTTTLTPALTPCFTPTFSLYLAIIFIFIFIFYFYFYLRFATNTSTPIVARSLCKIRNQPCKHPRCYTPCPQPCQYATADKNQHRQILPNRSIYPCYDCLQHVFVYQLDRLPQNHSTYSKTTPKNRHHQCNKPKCYLRHRIVAH
ncbi:hypothetical protein AX774_g4418 [Zancudomyces culisetae]|uniref:Uncharacterized protein n=1 Tax=Zancudomyces culisetae TaxID=1213189 RepID=A0A1R1PMC6_ZANCU|nr:hypothetical protein AX774_g4418 [Zancudomyces culisetae]|eukprot:OMH82121.1 hypothetical protein AX774_g4418 [Zancudomyces culisetae]